MRKRSPSKGIPIMRLGRVVAALLAMVLVLALSTSILWRPDPRRLGSKMRKLNAYLEQGEVLEFNYSSFPALRKLFETFEGSARLHVAPNSRMGAYDKSCEAYYEESLSLFPNGKLNRSAYGQLEYLHRVHHLNRTGRMEVRACDTASPHGCCLACNVPNCCLCAYDGEADLGRDLETVPAMKNLRVDSMTGRSELPPPPMPLCLSISLCMCARALIHLVTDILSLSICLSLSSSFLNGGRVQSEEQGGGAHFGDPLREGHGEAGVQGRQQVLPKAHHNQELLLHAPRRVPRLAHKQIRQQQGSLQNLPHQRG